MPAKMSAKRQIVKFEEGSISKDRNLNSFMIGVLDGLASPALFVAGDLEHITNKKVSTAGDSWKKVGQQIRTSANKYGAFKRG